MDTHTPHTHTHGHGPGCGAGAEAQCVCMRCGAEVAHVAGQPCRRVRCAACGAALLRKGSRHHQQALARQAAKAAEDAGR